MARPVADVVVIGGGVAGLSAARAAVGLDLDVVVLVGPQPPASAVAAGMIAPVGELSWGEEPMHRAAVAAAEAWPEYASELSSEAGADVPYRRSGALHLALDRDEAVELARREQLIGSHGLAYERLTRTAARSLEPALSPSIAAASVVPDEAEVDPKLLLSALRTIVGERAEVLEAEAEVLEVDGEPLAPGQRSGRVVGVRTVNGEVIRADQVVVAAGAWTDRLLPKPARLGVRPIKGQILKLRPRGAESSPCQRIIVTERIYIVPREGGEVLVGATVEEQGFDLAVTAGGVHELLREAYRVLPEIAEMELVDASAGLRPGTPDNAPIVGATRVDGLAVATGAYRNGILLAPLIERAVAVTLTGDSPPEPMAAFVPDRVASRVSA